MPPTTADHPSDKKDHPLNINSTKPRILMLGWEYPPRITGGLGVACQGLFKALDDEVKLTLVLPSDPSADGEGSADDPRFDTPSLLGPYFDADPGQAGGLYGTDLPVLVREFENKATNQASQLSFDLIHAHDWMTARAGLELRRRTGKPLVFHVHSLGYDRAGGNEQKWIHQIESEILQRADLIIAVSRRMREICLGHYGAPPSKTMVVHNGAAPVRFFRSEKPFPEKLVVFLGRLTAQKGPDLFLEIARDVLARKQKVRFAIAGAGDQLRSLMAGARRLGIQSSCHFTGFLERDKVGQLLSMADAFCMPSRSEPFGLSALEASQFGIPLVLSEESGAREILPEARCAPASDTGMLARHLLDALNSDHPKRSRQVRSWREAAQDIVGHYRALLT